MNGCSSVCIHFHIWILPMMSLFLPNHLNSSYLYLRWQHRSCISGSTWTGRRQKSSFGQQGGWAINNYSYTFLAIVQAWRFSLFGHVVQMPDETEAKEILENWRRPPGCSRIMWKTIQPELKFSNLSLNEAIDMAQNRPLWRLMLSVLCTPSDACQKWMIECVCLVIFFSCLSEYKTLYVSAQCEVDGDFEKFEEVGDEFFSSLTDERIEDLKILHGIKEGCCFVNISVNVKIVC